MQSRATLIFLACMVQPVLAVAQLAPAVPAAEAAVVAPENAREGGGLPYRYPMPALAQSVREMQYTAQAMILREYCADKTIPDDFVNERLVEFSKITGRPENCRSLLEY